MVLNTHDIQLTKAIGGFRNYDAATSNERRRFVVPHRPRPTLRPRWFALRRCACFPFPVPWLAPKVDALEYLEFDFRALDDEFKKRRRNGRFKATEVRIIVGEVIANAEGRADRVRHFREDVERTGSDSGCACACSVAGRDEAGA